MRTRPVRPSRTPLPHGGTRRRISSTSSRVLYPQPANPLPPVLPAMVLAPQLTTWMPPPPVFPLLQPRAREGPRSHPVKQDRVQALEQRLRRRLVPGLGLPLLLRPPRRSAARRRRFPWFRSEDAMVSTRVYGEYQRDQVGWFLGLTGLQLGILASGALPAVSAVHAGAWRWAFAGVLGWVVLLGLVVVPVHGRTASGWAVAAAMSLLGRRAGWSYLPQPPEPRPDGAGGDARPSGGPVRPPGSRPDWRRSAGGAAAASSVPGLGGDGSGDPPGRLVGDAG